MSRRSKNLTPTATDTATQPNHHAVPASNACAKVGRRRHGCLIPNRHTVLGAAHSSTALLRVGQVLAHQRLQLLDGLLLRLRQLARGPVAHAVWHTHNTPRTACASLGWAHARLVVVVLGATSYVQAVHLHCGQVLFRAV